MPHTLSHLLTLPVKPGGFMESQSGIQRNRPVIFCRFEEPSPKGKLAFVLTHPTSNFHNHYLIEPLLNRGGAVLALNTRYSGNDSMLLMERAAMDLGAGIRFLRGRGYERIILIGNSGGGSLAAFYQSQAETLGFADTPDGRPLGITAGDIPPADGIVLTCAHPGRAEQLLTKIDPAVTDEADPELNDPALDMYNPDNGPAYAPAWVERYRAAQAARIDRITAHVLSRLRQLDDTRPPETADEAFVIHRTQADPRLLDLSLDANDRKAGSIQGAAAHANYAANGLGRFCTLRSYLSQWSPAHSRANGPKRLAETACPVLLVEHTADQTVFPSHMRAWAAACEGRQTYHVLKGAPHYLDSHPHLIDETADLLLDWAG
ncbi:alpha/beta hydrolase [Antarcticimicrobium luteum]|uniref:Alpha/beta hydrolase n=1 Tax=Antarcticimicrobium luteum TaxID=2547397 RepID=A0A4R5V2L1_9RHOB|nr:alpha/beta hydrolase [Antarcticimicrobium luteum]TDK45676.1 alpha/beta hydrolase [Antarcticimicrobium luteum]